MPNSLRLRAFPLELGDSRLPSAQGHARCKIGEMGVVVVKGEARLIDQGWSAASDNLEPNPEGSRYAVSRGQRTTPTSTKGIDIGETVGVIRWRDGS